MWNSRTNSVSFLRPTHLFEQQDPSWRRYTQRKKKHNKPICKIWIYKIAVNQIPRFFNIHTHRWHSIVQFLLLAVCLTFLRLWKARCERATGARHTHVYSQWVNGFYCAPFAFMESTHTAICGLSQIRANSTKKSPFFCSSFIQLIWVSILIQISFFFSFASLVFCRREKPTRSTIFSSFNFIFLDGIFILFIRCSFRRKKPSFFLVTLYLHSRYVCSMAGNAWKNCVKKTVLFALDYIDLLSHSFHVRSMKGKNWKKEKLST